MLYKKNYITLWKYTIYLETSERVKAYPHLLGQDDSQNLSLSRLSTLHQITLVFINYLTNAYSLQ